MPSGNGDRWRELAEDMRAPWAEGAFPETREAMLRTAAQWEHKARIADIEVKQGRSRLN